MKQVFRDKIVLIVCAICLGITVAVAVSAVVHKRNESPFPEYIRATADVPLWYPASLPAGLTIDPASFSYKPGVLIYKFDAPDSKLHFTVQQTDPAFNFNIFYTKTMERPTSVITPNGTAHIGNIGGNTVGSITIGDIWILATYNQNNFADQLGQIMQSLRRY